jgi:hypothetical protein
VSFISFFSSSTLSKVSLIASASEMPGGYIDSWSGTQPVVKR